MLSIYFRKALTLLILLTLWSMASSIHARGANHDAERITRSRGINHDAERTTRSRGVNHDAEIKCIATALYYEARGESNRGKEAVAHVIINRAKARHWPNTACGVVYERNAFSWTTRPHLRGNRPYRHVANTQNVHYRIARDVYWAERMGRRHDITNRAYFFESNGRRPARSAIQPRRIGRHTFYKLHPRWA